MNPEKTDNLTDDELYSRFLSGDTDSFDRLLIRYGDSLTRYLYGYLKSPEDAEDMMIEAFARVMAKAPHISEGAFKSYLFKTGRNLAIRFHERMLHLKTFSMDGLDEEALDYLIAQNSEDGTDASPEEEEIDEKERKKVLIMCLGRIDPEGRAAAGIGIDEGLRHDDGLAVRILGFEAGGQESLGEGPGAAIENRHLFSVEAEQGVVHAQGV